MRIALDARQLYRPDRRGIGKTLALLYDELARLKPEWEFVFYHDRDCRAPEFEGRANVRAARLDFPGSGRANSWERFALVGAARLGGADLLHAPANGGPTWAPTPLAVTLHDLIPYELTPDLPESKAWLARTRATAGRARVILTPSRWVAGRLVELLGVPESRVHVTPWTPDPRLALVTDPIRLDAARREVGVPAGCAYFFGFGAADPRKNTATLLRAYARLPADLRAEVHLVLVGVQPAALASFRALAGELGVAAQCHLVGYIAEDWLAPFLSGSRALVFPSHSEGFGLPILDAFVCRTPVLAGDRTSLPEVAGGAAHLVDASDIEQIVAGLAVLGTDAAYRARLVEAGSARLAEFTWAGAAAKTAAAFETAVA